MVSSSLLILAPISSAPYRVLGSYEATLVAAALFAVVTVLGPITLYSRSDLSPRRYAIFSGVGYGIAYYGLFWVVQITTFVLPNTYYSRTAVPSLSELVTTPTGLAQFILLFFVPILLYLSIQAALAQFLYAWRKLKLPLGVLFALSLFYGLVFLQVSNGDSGILVALIFFGLFISVPGILAMLLLGAIEAWATETLRERTAST